MGSSGFTTLQNIEEVTEIKMDKIKGNTKSKRISDIRKLYIKNLKKYTDLSNKEIANLLEIGSSTITNMLSRRYKENDFIIKSSMEINKNVNLWTQRCSLTIKNLYFLFKKEGFFKYLLYR